MKAIEANGFQELNELESSYKYESWKRRQKENRKSSFRKNRVRYIIALTAATVMVFILMSITSANSVDASMKTPEKSFAAITVSAGDTLWSIAEEHINEKYYSTRQFIDEVKAMNSLTNDVIRAGDSLLIPVLLEESTDY